jgi:hypothetical protein
MVQFSLAVDPLPIVLFWLNFCAWVVIWWGLVIRDKRCDVHPPTDQGSRTLIGISLWKGPPAASAVRLSGAGPVCRDGGRRRSARLAAALYPRTESACGVCRLHAAARESAKSWEHSGVTWA